jgi:hypothetical protein
MNTYVRRTVFALIAPMALIGGATAQVAPRFDTVDVAAEVPAGKVRLPTGRDSSLVMPSCGDCPPKSYRVTLATAYFIGSVRVTLGELAAAVTGRPDMPLTVSYSVKTDEVTSVTADIVTSARSR